MSLLDTLTKIAVGIAESKAKPARRTTKPAVKRTTRRAPVPDASTMGGIMEEILGVGKSRKTTTRRAPSSLDDLLGGSAKTTRTRKTAPKGGIEDLIGSVLGGKSGGSLGDLFGAVLGKTTDAARSIPAPDQQDQAEAALLLRAMIQAAKADGTLDAGEKAHLMQSAGEASAAEIAFINAELAAPVDVVALVADVPRGMEEKIYMVSLMAITLDLRAEAEYLHALATELGLSPEDVNPIHDHLSAPRIY